MFRSARACLPCLACCFFAFVLFCIFVFFSLAPVCCSFHCWGHEELCTVAVYLSRLHQTVSFFLQTYLYPSQPVTFAPFFVFFLRIDQTWLPNSLQCMLETAHYLLGLACCAWQTLNELPKQQPQPQTQSIPYIAKVCRKSAWYMLQS